MGTVRLADSVTGHRHDFYLGAYGSPESHARYAALIQRWEAAGRRLAGLIRVAQTADRGWDVHQIADLYLDDVDSRRYSRQHRQNIYTAIRSAISLYGAMSAVEFGPAQLRAIRTAMIEGDPNATPPRRPWSRSTSNAHTRYVVAMFRWAVAEQLLPPHVWEALRAVEPLQRGRSEAAEPRQVRPVPIEFARAVIPHVAPQVAAMIELQLVTGMRPGEACMMRTIDVDSAGRYWIYRPKHHKTELHGIERIILIGRRGQEVLRPWLRPNVEEFLFQPREAEQARLEARNATRKTPASHGNSPGTNRKARPRKAPGEQYTSASYRQAIRRGCLAAGVELWKPNQLRHTFATHARAECGPEAVQIALGHRNLKTTEIYAETNQRLAELIAERLG